MITHLKDKLRTVALIAVVALFGAMVWASWHGEPGAVQCASSAGAAIVSILPSVMKNKRFQQALALQPGPAGLGFPQSRPLDRNYVYDYLQARLTAQVDVAAGGGADGALAPEQPWSLIRNLKILATSSTRPLISEIINMDFAALSVLQTILQARACPVTALAIPGIQAATQIAAQLDIPFYLPRSGNPRLGALNTHELNSLDIEAQWGTDVDLIVGGTRVTTLSNVQLQISASEFLDQLSQRAKYCVNMARTIEIPAPVATTRLETEIKGSLILRGVLIKQFTRVGTVHTPVETVINAITLAVNGTPKLVWATNGTAGSGFQLLKGDNEGNYSVRPNLGYAFIDLLREGQFDTLMQESVFTKISVILDVNTVANSVIRLFPVETVDTIQ